MDITTCKHEWESLERQRLKIDVTRKALLQAGGQSHYEIIAKCTKPGCFAGRTRDGEVFADVRPGEKPEGEHVTRRIGWIAPILKPKPHRT